MRTWEEGSWVGHCTLLEMGRGGGACTWFHVTAAVDEWKANADVRHVGHYLLNTFKQSLSLAPGAHRLG